MVLIWNFVRDMYGQEQYERYHNNTINNSFRSWKSRLNLIGVFHE